MRRTLYCLGTIFKSQTKMKKIELLNTLAHWTLANCDMKFILCAADQLTQQ